MPEQNVQPGTDHLTDAVETPQAHPPRLAALIERLLPPLRTEFGADRCTATTYRDELTIAVAPEDLYDVITFLRDDASLRFSMLKDVLCVDFNRRTDRFAVNYNLWSLENRMRVRVTTVAQEKDPSVRSITDLYPAADWYEREAYDMHGVIFDGHPDLRRMYMPEDFVDPESGEPLYPLRKDFPVMGVEGSLPLPDRDIDSSSE